MSPLPEAAGCIASLRPLRRAGSAWDFPLSKGDKALRLIKLFEAEVEHCHQEIASLSRDNQALLRRISTPPISCPEQAATRPRACGSDHRADDGGEQSGRRRGGPPAQDEQLASMDGALEHPAHLDISDPQALFGCKSDEEDQLVVLEYLQSAALSWQRTAEVRAQKLEEAQQEVCKVKHLEEQVALHQQRELELRTSLALLREFGHEEFMQHLSARGPRPAGDLPPCGGAAAAAAGAPEAVQARPTEEPAPAQRRRRQSAKIASVLIAAELDLGFTTATLEVAPWQSRADFHDIVSAFLEQHRVRPVFAEALVRYLEEVEGTATSFPARVQANLADLYSLHG